MRIEGHGVVWNPQEGRVLCRFENGIFETEDPEILRKLAELRYIEFPKENEVLKDVEKENEPTPEEPTQNTNPEKKVRQRRTGVKK